MFRRKRTAKDFRSEMQAHIDNETQRLREQGLSEEEARAGAERRFGNVTRAEERFYESRRWLFWDHFSRDVRFGARVLRKSPGFTAVAILTLALGIGANSVVFGVLNSLILKPLNVPNAESLWEIDRAGKARGATNYQSYKDYLDLRDRNRSFDGLAAYNITEAAIDTGDNPTRAWMYEVSGNYFDVLRIQPFLGRVLRASDEHGPNSAPYIVLTYDYWHVHFQDDRGVVGRKVLLNKHPYTILGVTPAGFRGTVLFFAPDMFVPMINQEDIDGVNELDDRGNRWVFEIFGHVKDGVNTAQATADLNSIGSYLSANYPKEDGQASFALSRPSLVGNFIGGPARAFAKGLMLLAGLILLAACANLGSLFAARAADRSREVALRLALGASRGRVLRQMFTEALIISTVGGVAGLWGSVVLLRALGAWTPFTRFPIHIPVEPDAKVYGVAVLLSFASGFLFGAVPIRQVLHTDPYEIVKGGATQKPGRRISVRDVLLVAQIAICAVLVTSSFVAARGLVRSVHANFGIEPQRALLVEPDLRMAGYTLEQIPAARKKMLDAIAALPGVTAAAVTGYPPLAMGGNTTIVFHDDTADFRPSNAVVAPFFFRVSPGYFDAAGTALLAGRAFTWHDDKEAPKVAVVNQLFAKRLFGAADPLGKYFKLRDGTRYQVIGIVADGKYLNVAEEPTTAIFFPILQSESGETWMVVRSSGDPQQIAGEVRTTLRGMDPGLPLYIQTWIKEMNGALFASRMATVSLGVLGVMGAMLSITGIFGMAAYSVSKRRRELGIRVAVGAQRKEILEAALGRAFKLLAIGSLAGLVLGLLATKVLAFIVYQASPRDPVVLTGAVLAMLLLGLLATWIPARRALSVDPLILMREE